MATLSATLQKLMEEQKADRLEAKLLRDLLAHKTVVETLASQLAKANLSAGPKEEAMPPPYGKRTQDIPPRKTST